MKIATILVTRSASCHVKTLHSILKINMKCLQGGIDNQIVYVNDDPYDKADMIQKYMKLHERIVFIDFGINLDDESINQIFEKHETVGCLVFPGVKSGINWTGFRAKVKEGSTEPVSQMGLDFDTDVGLKISDNIYRVTSTQARAWVMTQRTSSRPSKTKRLVTIKFIPECLRKFKEQGVRIYAFTAAKLTMTYTHECVSNILNAAGVKVN